MVVTLLLRPGVQGRPGVVLTYGMRAAHNAHIFYLPSCIDQSTLPLKPSLWWKENTVMQVVRK